MDITSYILAKKYIEELFNENGVDTSKMAT
jgi:hypothetical protein